MPNFTKKAIEASFLKLLNERPLSKITVKDIVTDCGINRNSFYYHFEDIPSLMKSIMNEAFDELIVQQPVFATLEDCIKATIKFIVRNKRAFLHIYHSVNRDVFEEYLWDACRYYIARFLESYFSDCQIDERDKTIVQEYYVSALYGDLPVACNEGERRYHRTLRQTARIERRIDRRIVSPHQRQINRKEPHGSFFCANGGVCPNFGQFYCRA